MSLRTSLLALFRRVLPDAHVGTVVNNMRRLLPHRELQTQEGLFEELRRSYDAAESLMFFAHEEEELRFRRSFLERWISFDSERQTVSIDADEGFEAMRRSVTNAAEFWAEGEELLPDAARMRAPWPARLSHPPVSTLLAQKVRVWSEGTGQIRTTRAFARRGSVVMESTQRAFDVRREGRVIFSAQRRGHDRFLIGAGEADASRRRVVPASALAPFLVRRLSDTRPSS